MTDGAAAAAGAGGMGIFAGGGGGGGAVAGGFCAVESAGADGRGGAGTSVVCKGVAGGLGTLAGAGGGKGGVGTGTFGGAAGGGGGGMGTAADGRPCTATPGVIEAAAATSPGVPAKVPGAFASCVALPGCTPPPPRLECPVLRLAWSSKLPKPDSASIWRAWACSAAVLG